MSAWLLVICILDWRGDIKACAAELDVVTFSSRVSIVQNNERREQEVLLSAI